MTTRDSYCMLFLGLVALAAGGTVLERILRSLPLHPDAQRVSQSLVGSGN